MAGDPYKYFRLEAAELVDELGKGLAALASAPDPAGVARMLRHAHTLKGAARVVRLTALADVAHQIEDVLEPYRKAAHALAPEHAAAIGALLDQLTAGLAQLDRPAVAATPQRAEEPVRVIRAELAELDVLHEAAAEANAAVRTIRDETGGLALIRQLAETLALQVSDDGTRGLAHRLRDEATRVARAISSRLDQSIQELGQVLASAEQLRLAAVAGLQVTIERTARDTAAAVNKHVVVTVEGGDVRLESDVLGLVQTALVQLVRNAVAHGIEGPDQRRAAGKPEAGTIAIEVIRRGARVHIACRDDGAGIDHDAVRRAAQRLGLPTPPPNASATELLAVLLHGGVSTAAGVTSVAGRGVGLDVVGDVARRLGGEVTASSTPGRGTVFELIIPTAMASLEVLSVEAGGARAAIPLRSIVVTRQVREGDIVRDGTREAIVHGDVAIPLVRIAAAIGGDASASRRRRSWVALVLQTAAGQVAICADRAAAISTVISRAIPQVAAVHPIIAGASIDADGRAELVLDPEQLAGYTAEVEPDAPARRHAVLVIDDSLTTRMLERSILESAGYDVDLATSAEEGLEAARNRPYSLILCDVEMPGMDGFSFVERIRADPHLRDIPALLVSSRASPADFQRGRDAGAQGYIVKSQFDQVALLAQIARLLEAP
jgi:two-component system chemotaxis sensor kinase CheA